MYFLNCDYYQYVYYLLLLYIGPFHYPTNFTGKALSSHSLLLTWMPLPSDQWNAPYLTDYVLFCTTTNYNKNNNNNNNQESDGCGKRFLSVSGNKSSLLVDNLSPFTTYSFIVAAKNAAGYGPSSNTIYTTTMEDGKSYYVHVHIYSGTSL